MAYSNVSELFLSKNKKKKKSPSTIIIFIHLCRANLVFLWNIDKLFVFFKINLFIWLPWVLEAARGI